MVPVAVENRGFFPRIGDLQQRNLIPFLSDLETLAARLLHAGFARDLVVHGSFGDFTFTSFSDLELTVLLSRDSSLPSLKSLRGSPRLIRDINRFIISVDPLQHHGAFYLTPDDISSYDEQILPLSAYRDAWSVHGSTIDFSVSRSIENTTSLSREKLAVTLKRLQELDRAFFRHGRGCFSIKRVVSNFLMVPVYYFQAKGIPVSKRSALKRALTDLPDPFHEPITRATAIRADWPAAPQWLKRIRSSIVHSRIPQNRLDQLVANRFSDSRVLEQFSRQFLPALNRFLAACREGCFEDLQ